MKILSAICLAIMFLITSPFFIPFLGGAELFKLYNDILKIIEERLGRKEE